jgi:phospholipid/cholesterol/gamma-HCH transport system substrate-binding protein
VRALKRASARTGLDPRAVIGLAALVLGAVIWYLTFTNALPHLIQTLQGAQTTEIRADFATIDEIVPGDPVRVDGVQVGEVGGSTLDRGARSTTLTLNLSSNAPPIYRNAHVAIRWRTVLGANDAVNIDPGTRSSGPLGSATIPQSHTGSQVELDQITQTLHGQAQQGIRTTLKQLGPAFADQAAPAGAFTTLARVAPVLTRGIGALRGLDPDVDLQSLVRTAARAADALDVGAGASETRQFIEAATSTLDTTSANAAAIQATIADASTTLPTVTETASRLNHTLSLADPLIATLTPVAPSVAPTLANLHPTVVHLSALLHVARPMLSSLRPSVDALSTAARTGVPLIDQLAPGLQRVDTQILPSFDRVSPESKHALYEMVGPLFSGLDGVGAHFDANGHFARLTASGDTNAAAGLLPCRVEFQNPGQLLTCETVIDYLDQLFTPGSGSGSSALHRLATSDPALGRKLTDLATGSGGAQ